ncbi:MAG: GTP-binding protein, partial [Bacteroidota bacterium]
MHDQKIKTDQGPIPVTLLTGFLGTGKTTLLNRIIQERPSTRFAIIENEFGDINIDRELVVELEDCVFELSNGCICCTLNDGLTETLVNLIKRKADFDHLLIETTGVAEPDGIATTFLSHPDVQQHFRLDATICLADATAEPGLYFQEEEALRQISFADCILLNKQAEASDAAKTDLIETIRSINPLADIVPCDFGKVDFNLLDLHAYSPESLAAKLERSTSTGHHHNHTDLKSHSFKIDQPFDMIKIRHWLNVLLMVQRAQIYRVKGILNVQFQEHRSILQSVRQSHVFTQGDAWGDGELRESKLVIIGKGIQPEMLDRALRSCLY